MAHRRRSRSMHGLGDSPKGHANKALSLEGSAMKDFKQAVKSGRSCKAAFALYTNGTITMGEAMAHRSESYGTAPKRDASLEKASEKAYAAIRGCLSDGSLSGLRRRPALGAASLPKAEGIDKKGRKVKLVVKKDRDFEEWQVRVSVNGKYNPRETYFAGDNKEDAVATLTAMKKQYGLAGMRKRRVRKF